MYFERIPDLTITDICIWLDNHMYDTAVDKSKVYRYLYYICRRLSAQEKFQFFNNKQYQDDFCLYAALQLWYRIYISKSSNVKINYILDYAKKSIYGLRANYLKQFTCTEKPFDISLFNNFRSKLISMVKSISQIEFRYYIENDLINMIKLFLKHRICYNINNALGHNIYMSCLLSFLSALTLSNKNKRRLKKHSQKAIAEFIDQLYQEEQENCIMLYNLPKQYYDYVSIIVKELKHHIGAELYSLLKYEDIDETIFIIDTYLTDDGDVNEK